MKFTTKKLLISKILNIYAQYIFRPWNFHAYGIFFQTKLLYSSTMYIIWQYMSTIVYSDIYFLFLVPALFVGKFKTEKIHNNF